MSAMDAMHRILHAYRLPRQLAVAFIVAAEKRDTHVLKRLLPIAPEG
jgi:hypothetical protein